MGERAKDPIERLRALDQAFARRGASRRSRDEVRRKLQKKAVEHPFHARLRWWPAIAFAAGAAMMGLLLVSNGADEGSPTLAVVEPAPVEPAPGIEPAEPLKVAATAERDEPLAVEPAPGPVCAALGPGPLHLDTDACAGGDGVRISALLPSDLEHDATTIELRAGELLFDVAPRPERPLHVRLGELDIEVVGTRFIVHRDASQAWISMLEGHVRTRVGEGPVRDLRDTERLEWPEPTTPSAARRRSPKTAGRDEGLALLLSEVSALRRRGAYREAVERMRSTDTRGWSARARQLVSYEIGTLLDRQLGAAAEACAHWGEHRRRYPSGRHDAIVRAAIERLGCDDE